MTPLVIAMRVRGAGRPVLVTLLLASALGVAPRPAAAADVLITGKRLRLSADQQNPARRRMGFRSVDAAIAPPFPDPLGGASLFIHSSSAAGQCRAEIALPAGNWTPIRDDGPNRGWRYRDRMGTAQGIRKVVLTQRQGGGRLVVAARGSGFPCGLEASVHRTPVAVVLTVGATRYCASFGGEIAGNRTGGLKAKDAPAPSECFDEDVTVATLNVLHGLFCPVPTASCRLADRIDLLGQWIAARGCPDAVALQEVAGGSAGAMVGLIRDRLTNVCPFLYEVVYAPQSVPATDDSLVLSRYPALSTAVQPLWGLPNLRNVFHARLDHPLGPVDVFSTHLAAGVDAGSSPCSVFGPCPAPCVAAGAVTVRDCQAVQLADFVTAQHDVDTPAVIAGDFNAQPSSFVYGHLVGRGWPDVYTAVGNPECVAATGVGCTSGREDQALTDLESPALGVSVRIDYAFLVPPGPTSDCVGTIDSAADDDGDGVATRHFAEEPNPFAGTCGPAPDPICWVSDHNGVQVDVDCR